jgi:phage replication initiation protein
MKNDDLGKGTYVQPPLGNTGVLCTHPNGLRALVDWVSFTFTSEDFSLENVFNLLNLEQKNFVPFGGKVYGYISHIQYQGITIHYDGQKGMGIHIEITGQGCRWYENGREEYGKSWDKLFSEILENDGHFTRLDVAIDDFHGYFRIPRLVTLIKKQCLISKFRRAKPIEDIEIGSGESIGTTIYYGRPQSEIQIRMYEKNFERLSAGVEVDEKVTCWNRTEIQARDMRAYAIARHIAKGDMELGELVSGILANYLRFVKPTNDSNRRRWPTAPFWEKFLRNAQKISLSLVAPDMTIERKAGWLFDQISKTFFQVWTAFKNNPEMLDQFLKAGEERMSEDDWKLVEDFQRVTKEDSFEELVRKYGEWNRRKQEIEEEIAERKKIAGDTDEK